MLVYTPHTHPHTHADTREPLQKQNEEGGEVEYVCVMRGQPLLKMVRYPRPVVLGGNLQQKQTTQLLKACLGPDPPRKVHSCSNYQGKER